MWRGLGRLWVSWGKVGVLFLVNEKLCRFDFEVGMLIGTN